MPFASSRALVRNTAHRSAMTVSSGLLKGYAGASTLKVGLRFDASWNRCGDVAALRILPHPSSILDWWMALLPRPDAFEGSGGAKDREVIEWPSDDLHADRNAV